MSLYRSACCYIVTGACFIGPAAYGSIGRYMVYGHLYFADICRTVSHFKFPAFLKSFSCLRCFAFLGYLLEAKKTELFFVEFIQCHLMDVVGTSKTGSATSKQNTSRTSSNQTALSRLSIASKELFNFNSLTSTQLCTIFFTNVLIQGKALFFQATQFRLSFKIN